MCDCIIFLLGSIVFNLIFNQDLNLWSYKDQSGKNNVFILYLPSC